MTHPSDDIAQNLDTLFVAPDVGDVQKQARVDAVVAAAKTFAQSVIAEIPDACCDRQDALVAIRSACDRAVSAVAHEIILPQEPEPGPEL